MYYIPKLPDPHPYRCPRRRPYLSSEAKEYYDMVKQKFQKQGPPQWIYEWNNQFVKLKILYRFTTNRWPDMNNLDICLVNAVMFALQEFKEDFDDKWICIEHEVPKFGKKVGVSFDISLCD